MLTSGIVLNGLILSASFDADSIDFHIFDQSYRWRLFLFLVTRLVFATPDYSSFSVTLASI